jgi:hypothetical protein
VVGLRTDSTGFANHVRQPETSGGSDHRGAVSVNHDTRSCPGAVIAHSPRPIVQLRRDGRTVYPIPRATALSGIPRGTSAELPRAELTRSLIIRARNRPKRSCTPKPNRCSWTVTGKSRTTRTHPEKRRTRRSTVSSNSAQSGTNPTRTPNGGQSWKPAQTHHEQRTCRRPRCPEVCGRVSAPTSFSTPCA